MEINIAKKGDLQILTVKGKTRLQSWRVLDKHLESLLHKGSQWVALDLGEVSFICSSGIGSIVHNIRKFEEKDGRLMVVATSSYVQEQFALFGCDTFMGDHFYSDWRALEKRLHSQGLALTG